jgi:hypothetical protein
LPSFCKAGDNSSAVHEYWRQTHQQHQGESGTEEDDDEDENGDLHAPLFMSPYAIEEQQQQICNGVRPPPPPYLPQGNNKPKNGGGDSAPRTPTGKVIATSIPVSKLLAGVLKIF